MKIDRLRDALKENFDLVDLSATSDGDYLLKLLDDYAEMYADICRAIEITHPASRWSLILNQAKSRYEKLLMEP